MMVNLEIKSPEKPEIKQIYRWKQAVKLLHELIVESQMTEYVVITSFDFETLQEMERIN